MIEQSPSSHEDGCQSFCCLFNCNRGFLQDFIYELLSSSSLSMDSKNGRQNCQHLLFTLEHTKLLSFFLLNIFITIMNHSLKLHKTFFKFYRQYYDLIFKFHVGLKSLLRQGVSEPEFYGDLVFKLKKIVGSCYISAQFIEIIIKRLTITLMYCNRLHAWWSTQSWFAVCLPV